MKYAAYDEYKPSGADWLGEVPTHWTVKAIKWESPVLRGASPRPIDDPIYFDDDGEYAWVRISDVTEAGTYLEKTEQKLSDVGTRLSVKLKPGDLFLSIAGSVGKPCITRIKCCIHDGFVYFPRWKADPKFLYYLFASGEPYKGLGKMGTQLNLNTDTVGSIVIGLPDAEEQQTIARFLDAKTAQIDALVVQKRQLIAKLKEKRSALIARTVTRGLPPEVAKAAGLEPNPEMKDSGVDWLGEIPTHWQLPPLFRVVRSIQTGPFGTQLHQADYVDDEVPLINPIHLVDGELRADSKNTVTPETADRLSRYKLVSGDVVFARRGDIGRCGVTLPEQEGWLCGTGSMVVRLHEDYCDPGYYALVFRSSGFSSLLELNAVGTTMLNLNPSILGRMLIPVPPLTEQKSILVFLEGEILKFDNLMQYVETAIARLTEYRQALITSAVTGKIDVRNWQSELVAA